MSTEDTVIDITVNTENNDTIEVISFSNPDLDIVQNIVVAAGNTLDNIVEGLNLGSLTTTLDHGGEPSYIVTTTGHQVATIVSQEVTVTGTGFGDYANVRSDYDEAVPDMQAD